jgi:hypothetical protein
VVIWPRVRVALAADVPTATAAGGAPVTVMIGGGAREVWRELGKAREWPAWAEVNGRRERTAALV